MRHFRRLVVALTLGVVVAALTAAQPLALSPNIVISQVYGGGGNSGATYTHDYIELFNRGSTSASLTGWSVQYASATGTGLFSSNITTLPSISLAPGQYALIQQAQGAGGTTALPTPDVAGSTNMSATGAKVALVNTTAGLACNGGTTPCSASQLALIVDLVGWGSADFFEGAAGPATTNTTAALRNANGCTETDNNASDFTAGAPTPRNTASPLSVCSVGDQAPAVSSTTPANGATGVALDADLSITFNEAVSLSGTWYDITCTTSGPHTATVSGGPTTFTLDPDPDFVDGDTCTVTVFAAQVTDQDTDDPPDNMAADYSFNFSAASLTPIHDIQGSGLSAAITGNVTTEGVVVGDFEGASGLLGFYMQSPDADADADPATSEGIFVFTGTSNLVNTGDYVRVSGYARERFNQTALNGSNSNTSPVTDVVVVSSGNALPSATDVVMPLPDANALERYEGMRVRLPQSLVISEYFNYDRFGEILLALPLGSESRPFTGTALESPGADAVTRTQMNLLRRITLDDGLGIQNPPSLRHPNGDPFSLSNRFRGGDTVTNTIGVLGYDFNLYRVQPTEPASYASTNTRPASPESVGGTLRVSAMNTLNYFLTLDYPSGNPLDNTCGPAQNVECRGADSDQPDEFTRQRTKLLAALEGLDSDIVGLNEVENTTGVEPLADVVAGLSGYDFVDTGTIGTDAIKVGLIYKPSTVIPVGDFEILDSTVDPRFRDTLNRPVLAQTFQEIATGALFTVAVNHLKSKGSNCNAVGDPDAGDGQGNCNGTRTLAAEALVDWLSTDPTGSGDPDFLIIGDLNSYAMEDPISAIKAGPDDTAGTDDDYVNLVSEYGGTYAYSYLFDGQFGYLDHALASASLAEQITGATEWHINADEPDVLDYDTTFKPPAQDALYEPNAYRSSDHDPVLVGLGLCETTPPTLTVSVTPNRLFPPNHKYVTVQATISASDNSGVAPTVTLDSVTSNEPDNAPGGADGNTTDDIVIVDDDTFRLRAERDENGTGRVYTITYTAIDGCGNSTTRSATVTVPISR